MFSSFSGNQIYLLFRFLSLDILWFLWLNCFTKNKEGTKMKEYEIHSSANYMTEGGNEECDCRSGEYEHILQLIARHEEKLTETLTEAQKETFKKFKDATSELSGMTEVTAFTIGFKLGLRLTAEALVGSDYGPEA